jgi:DNA-binding IclR family transcriptional regulator
VSASAGRALDLMTAVATTGHPMGLMELVDKSGLDKTTAGRLLAFLVQRGFLHKDPLTKRYEVGGALIAFAAAAMNRSGLRASAAAHLRGLSEATGETASLHLRVGDERICIDGTESSQPVRRVLSIGERVPLHASPTGKVILAFLGAPEATGALTAARAAGVDMSAMELDLARIRRQKYMIAVGDRTPGVGAVSVPVFDREEAPVASLTIAGPASRCTRTRMLEYVPLLAAAAAQISAGLTVRAA